MISERTPDNELDGRHYPAVIQYRTEDPKVCYEVRVLEDGTVQFHGFEPDEISKKVWEVLGHTLAERFQRPVRCSSDKKLMGKVTTELRLLWEELEGFKDQLRKCGIAMFADEAARIKRLEEMDEFTRMTIRKRQAYEEAQKDRQVVREAD